MGKKMSVDGKIISQKLRYLLDFLYITNNVNDNANMKYMYVMSACNIYVCIYICIIYVVYLTVIFQL